MNAFEGSKPNKHCGLGAPRAFLNFCFPSSHDCGGSVYICRSLKDHWSCCQYSKVHWWTYLVEIFVLGKLCTWQATVVAHKLGNECACSMENFWKAAEPAYSIRIRMGDMNTTLGILAWSRISLTFPLWLCHTVSGTGPQRFFSLPKLRMGYFNLLNRLAWATKALDPESLTSTINSSSLDALRIQ